MDHKRKKVLRDIDHWCKTSSMLIVTRHGILLMLNIPFRVMVITELTPFEVGDVVRVAAVKMDRDLLLMYLIENKLYYYNHFTVLLGEEDN